MDERSKKRGRWRIACSVLATPCTYCTALSVCAGPGPPFEFTGKMSYGKEEELRPPRTPEQWEALTDKEDRIDETTGNDDSDLEGAGHCGENQISQTNCLATDCPLVQFGKIGGKCLSFDSPGSHRSGKILDTFLQEIA